MIRALIFVTTFVFSMGSFANSKESAYRSVLNCPATKTAPAFMVVVKNHVWYLGTKVGAKIKLVEMIVNSADMGYLVFEAKRPASLGDSAKYFSSIEVLNNEEDIPDSSEAVVKGGSIRVKGRAERQKCNVTGVVKLADL